MKIKTDPGFVGAVAQLEAAHMQQLRQLQQACVLMDQRLRACQRGNASKLVRHELYSSGLLTKEPRRLTASEKKVARDVRGFFG